MQHIFFTTQIKIIKQIKNKGKSRGKQRIRPLYR